MPRTLLEQDPNIINTIESKNHSELRVLEIATHNQNKLIEFQRLLPEYKVVGKDLKMDEPQSLNALEVAAKKAKVAWEKNGFNPILIEDSSFELMGLNGRPGTLADFFISDPMMRKDIAENWLRDKDRRAVARVILAIYDGKEAFTFEGVTHGSVADFPRGTNGFGYDDIFIPQGSTKNKTFAEMTSTEKDKYSMRKKAAAEFKRSQIILNKYVLEIPEPFNSELRRVDKEKLTSPRALKFAYQLESLNNNKPNKDFTALKFKPLVEESNPFYLRYSFSKSSPSLGIILTDVDRISTQRYKNGNPMIWQFGPERRQLALAQRAEYFINNTDLELINGIKKIEKKLNKIPLRSNRTSQAVEVLLHGFSQTQTPIYARAIKELGYKKITSEQKVSRSAISRSGLINKVGKYPRLILGVGSMPAVSGWKDVIATSILGHMPVFIARNSIFAENVQGQIDLINAVKKDIKDLKLSKYNEEIVLRNIGVAIGTNNPKEEVNKAVMLNKKAGVKLFRIYTINGDPRCIETAKLLRKILGDEIEIFSGQITDKVQAQRYVREAAVDAIIFGHGGGRQCTSAVNGMAISTVEELYSITTDTEFNNTTLVVEGGVGTNVGPLMLMGIDCILYSNQLVRGTIEVGGVFLKDITTNEFVQPYHGSASAPTMIIEAANEMLHSARINASGRSKVPEGKPGFMKYSSKANSMSFWIEEFKHHVARTLADLGVKDMVELRAFLKSTNLDLLRIVSTEAAKTASAYGTNH